MKAEAIPRISIASSLKETSFFITIYLIFSGWLYKNYYLNCFGISAREVDLDFTDYLMFSFKIFENHRVIVSLILLTTVIIINEKKFNLLWLKFMILILFFPAINKLVIDTTLKEYNYIVDNQAGSYPIVTIIFEKNFLEIDNNQKPEFDRIVEENNYGRLKILFTNDKGYYFYSAKHQNKNDDWICYISKEKIKTIKITKTN